MQGTNGTTFHEHPEYQKNQTHWETYKDLFEGDHLTLTSAKYLWPHELEGSTQVASVDPASKATETVGQKIRRIRAQRSRYLNLIEPIVSTYCAMAFQKPPTLDAAAEELLGDDAKDVDGRGTSFEAFITNAIATAYFRDGKVVVSVDAPKNESRNRGEEVQSGFRPFLELLDVLDVKDWQIQDFGPDAGKYDWVRHEFCSIAPRASAQEEPQKVTYCRVAGKTQQGVAVSLYRAKGKAPGGAAADWEEESSQVLAAGFDEVPVVALEGNEPWLKDPSELALVLYNLMSAWYNQLNTQAFQRVFIAGDLGDKHIVSISEYAVGQIPPEAKPYVIEPSSMDALEKAIATTTDQMLRVAFNRSRGALSQDSKEAPAANTLQEMNEELVSLLKLAVEELENFANRILRLYAMFKLGPEKGKAFSGRVELSRDIKADNIERHLLLAGAYRDEIRKVLDWRKADLKKAARAMEYPKEDLAKILIGIEELKDEPLISPITGFGLGGKLPPGGQDMQVGDDGPEDEEDEEDEGGGAAPRPDQKAE